MQPTTRPVRIPPPSVARQDWARFRRLADLVRAELSQAQAARAVAEVEQPCPLHEARGRRIACDPANCPFYGAPGVDGCAVRAWYPRVSQDPEAAAWFMDRRVDAWARKRRRAFADRP
jgi:hypothetical protein